MKEIERRAVAAKGAGLATQEQHLAQPVEVVASAIVRSSLLGLSLLL